MKCLAEARLRQSGLSLMELLISLALLALVAGGLAGSMSLAFRLFDRSTGLIESSDALATRARLRVFLASAVPPSKLIPFPVQFSGGPREFEFVSMAATPFAPEAAAVRVRVAISGGDLEAVFAMLGHDGEVLDVISKKLTQSKAEIHFSYFSAGGSDEGWVDNWANQAMLPDLVRIQVSEGARPDWPEFTVRLQSR